MNGFKRLRLLASKSVEDAAEELNVSPSTVHGWEKRGFKPNANKLHKIAVVYGCSVEDVVNAYEAQD